ncbi:MAG: MltA domain-containing protein [Maritimibacter sp.]
MRGLIGLVLAGMVAFATPARAGLDEAEISILSFDDLHGWADDDHNAAMAVFLETCAQLHDPQWQPICGMAENYDGPAKSFFELFFRPVLIKAGHALQGRGLEIAWVSDPVALQFMLIQGSGRVRLSDGSIIRLGYAGSNGHPFRSLGDELARRGVLSRSQASAARISAWVKAHPAQADSLLHHNPSYVFFRVLGSISGDSGPVGAMNRSITARRSLAVDPEFTPLGAPVWLEKAGADPFNRLMVAQDTGSRIKGAQRADVFFGSGAEAGRLAGQVHDNGRMVVLLPIQRAYRLKPEG